MLFLKHVVCVPVCVCVRVRIKSSVTRRGSQQVRTHVTIAVLSEDLPLSGRGKHIAFTQECNVFTLEIHVCHCATSLAG